MTCINSKASIPFISIIEIFIRNSYLNPKKTAVFWNNEKLSYEDLNKESNLFASKLRLLGVEAGSYVACLLPKSPKLIISLLALFKIGAVYVPIDPSLRKEQIKFIFNSSNPSLFITDDPESDIYTPNNKCKTLSFNEIQTTQRCLQDDFITHKTQPNEIAYVVFTSGSTGNPKGILIEQQGLQYSITTHFEHYPTKMNGALTGSIGFDASLMTIFFMLSTNGTIFIPNENTNSDSRYLINFINKHKINFFLSVPTLYSMLLDKEEKMPSLTIVSTAGEPMPNSIPIKHLNYSPNAKLYNEYGPSEYGIGATIATIYDPSDKKINPISIGKPYTGNHVRILNHELKPVKPFEKGEICLSGPSLARGYLNKPDLTAEKFVTYNSERVYRTGDIGRFLPNGNLEIIGRLDNQVKIRGFRIELAEIEHVILQCPVVDECVVVVKEKQDQTKYLVAYYTSVNKKEVEAELKSFICKRLPNHMIPTKFVYLENFERTPVGKIDRKKLPEPSFNFNSNKYKKPQTKLQEILYLIWKTILCLDSLCLHDNFFDLGGNSFTLARLQTQIEKELNIKLSVTELLQYTTIFQLGEYLSNKIEPKNIRVYKDRAAKRKLALNRLRKRAVNE